jgi:hypothetical protein
LKELLPDALATKVPGDMDIFQLQILLAGTQ